MMSNEIDKNDVFSHDVATVVSCLVVVLLSIQIPVQTRDFQSPNLVVLDKNSGRPESDGLIFTVLGPDKEHPGTPLRDFIAGQLVRHARQRSNSTLT